MQVSELAVSKEDALKELETIKALMKKNSYFKRQAIVRDLYKCYGHLQHGGKIIDLHESFKKAGLNEKHQPRLAILRADAKICHCYLNVHDKSATFSVLQGISEPRKTRKDVRLPPNTFPTMPEVINWQQREIRCPVPLVKPQILLENVKRGLGGYYILWEVDEWKPIPPRDPILLKKLTDNLFGIIATWELTLLERAVIKGHIS